MDFNDKTLREISAIAVVLVFLVLVFFSIRPIFFAILWGMILAYIFFPVYNKLIHYIKNKTFSAILVSLIASIVIIVPLWFVMPIIVQQVFEIFRVSQSLDMSSFAHNLFPTASAQFTVQLGATINTLISKASSSVMTSIIDTFMNIPSMLINFVVICFVFFFTLRDSDKLKHFIKSVSPISPAKQQIWIKPFKDITYSIIYGNFIVGFVQGLTAGLGFLIFGVQNALVLTILAIFMAILPVAGAFMVWIPIAIYMFVQGNTTIGIAFVLYNVILVQNIDNILRVYILSKRTNLSPVFALISAVGGLFLFGVIGLILGPLIFAYFIILIDLYKEKNLLSIFAKEEPAEVKNPESK
jgi:predicted PurR-regulated permease PerM